MTGSLSGDSTLTLGKTAPFLPHEKAKMPHECPRFHVMSAGSHNRHSLFWVKGLQPNFELNLPGATFHLTSTIIALERLEENESAAVPDELE